MKKNNLNVILIIGFLFTTLFTNNSAFAKPLKDPDRGYPVYLPLVVSPPPQQVLLGVYTDTYLGVQSTIDSEVKAIDNWSGKHMSIVGTFIAFEDQNPNYNIRVPLGLIWDSGYTPFVNLDTKKTLADINSGKIDGQIQAMAKAFKSWREDGLSKKQNRKAFVAPLQEMNGNWVTYNGSPAEFKKAFYRIQNIFSQEGASAAVRWAFAPNGWSDTNQPPFEQYYPGDSHVEVNVFSSYNSGYCPTAAWKAWSTPSKVYDEYVQRMRNMAPHKSIFVAQTGTTAYDKSGYNVQAKNTWLKDAYTYFATTPGVAGVIYFNKGVAQKCDWPFFDPDGSKFDGYRLGVNQKGFVYMAPETLAEDPLTQ